MVAAAVGVGTAVAGVAGSAMSSSAAGKASSAQQRAAQQANDLERELYEKNTANFQPYLDAGNAGLQQLLFRMGLGTGIGNGKQLSEQEIRDELRGQYTKGGTSAGGKPPSLEELGYANGLGLARSGALQNAKGNATWTYDPNRGWGYRIEGMSPELSWISAPDWNPGPDSVDEAALDAAVQERLRQQQAAKNDPLYGSLLSTYKEYKPFSMEDFQVDPGYQFRLDQGNKSLQNMAAATGNLNSGRALKDAMNFSSGLASQEYGNAYNRYNNDYITGYNTFNTNQNNIYNKLAALAGMGQSSASSLAGVSQNYGAQVGNNLAQGANASAAGTVGQANAWNQGIGSAANALGNYAYNRGSGYSGAFQPTAGVGGLGAGQGVNGWW